MLTGGSMRDGQERQNGCRRLLHALADDEGFFLDRWSLHMARAGYLEHTTARRLDCMQALNEFLTPMFSHEESHANDDPEWPDYLWLVRNEGEWARTQIESARRHRMRGITADMYLGCFKTFIHSLVDVIEHMAGDFRDKAMARRLVRRYGDALEVLFVSDWTRTLPDLAAQRLDEANRLLTLEKCRFENILNATSDLLFVTGPDGRITNVNAAALHALPERKLFGVPVWELLNIEARSMEELLRYYPVGVSCEMSPLDNGLIYRMQMTPMNTVSLASDEYLIALTNVTSQASQRDALEQVVAQRTDDLLREKEHLEEMNITLRNVLKSIEKDRESFIRDISAKLGHIVLPALERIEAESDPAIRRGYVTVVRDQLARMTPGDEASDPLLLKLTPMEAKVCQFIQAGHSSKDIANSLNLSIETVQTHRKHIRRKLGLHGKTTGLYAHLKTAGLPS